MFGVGSVLATAQFNIWQGTKQRELQLTSTQLMYALSYPQVCCGASSCLRCILPHNASACSIGPLYFMKSAPIDR